MMNPLSFPVTLTCLLSVWIIRCTADCGALQVDVNGQCCDLCPPGTYLKNFCKGNKKTECRPCREGFYQDKYNHFDRCEECRTCQQEIAEKCEPTTDAKCSCRHGFLCSNNMCLSCEEDRCVTGEKLKRTESSLDGILIEYSYHCEPGSDPLPERPRGGVDSLHVILGIGFILLSLIILMALCYAFVRTLRKQRNKASNKPAVIGAVTTTACDCPLSKEECGLKLMIQDESKDSFDQPQTLKEFSLMSSL